MEKNIKAIVFRTTQLKATKDFFERILQFSIKESSLRHFVLYSKGLRLVFVESANDFEVELYMNDRSNEIFEKQYVDLPIAFKSYKDPNGINVIIKSTNKKKSLLKNK